MPKKWNFEQQQQPHIINFQYIQGVQYEKKNNAQHPFRVFEKIGEVLKD